MHSGPPSPLKIIMTRTSGVGCLLFMALFWNGIIGVFDFMIGRSAWQSWAANSSFVEVPVVITRAEVKVDSSGEGTSYTPNIEYRYTVDGEEYSGNRLSYTAFGSSDLSAAKKAVDNYPLGETVTALLDPDDPSEVVLDASIDSFPGALILFFMPFHCVGLGFLLLALRGFRQRGSAVDALRSRYVKVDTEYNVVIAKPMFSALTIFLIVLTAASFITTFPVIFLLGFEAPLSQVLPIVGACFAVAAFFGFQRWRKQRSPQSFLHIDKRLGLYSYPADAKGERIEDVQSVASTSKATGTTINDVPQSHHHYRATTPDGDVELFDVKMGEDEGERLRQLLEMELLNP